MELRSDEREVLEALIIKKIEDRGVSLKQIGELTYFLQEKYYDTLTVDDCVHHVKAVLKKREVQNAILTGIQLDELAEKGLLDYPLQDMVAKDYSLYGIDEILAFSIVNVYGSIGFTNFGYIDKVKPGILRELDIKDDEKGVCHTFLDDLIGAVAAAAASRIAHSGKFN
ncbi:MAG: phosphatidylglycerophosphatase A [Defluviitaleaceae bacterium]|nr:phosphatidylglycerophosphatase A [Defluviitaleaceae bacterium]